MIGSSATEEASDALLSLTWSQNSGLIIIQYRNNNSRQQASRWNPRRVASIWRRTQPASLFTGVSGDLSVWPHPRTLHGPSPPCPSHWAPLPWILPKLLRLLRTCLHLYQPVAHSLERMGREREGFDVSRGRKSLGWFFQGHLAAGRGCDSWWEGRRLGCDRSTVSGDCAALANLEVCSYSLVGGRDERERSEGLAHTTWEKRIQNYQITSRKLSLRFKTKWPKSSSLI